MENKIYNVLFLCTGNSARSIMAEAALSRWGLGKFKSFSAGSMPKDRVHPTALQVLQKHNYKTDQYRSKSWDEFAEQDAPQMDFVFTVCDRAASEVCPIWPGQPMTAHWGIVDPDREYANKEEEYRGFLRAYLELEQRIKIFTSLPIAGLDKLSLQKQLDDIGQNAGKNRKVNSLEDA